MFTISSLRYVRSLEYLLQTGCFMPADLSSNTSMTINAIAVPDESAQVLSDFFLRSATPEQALNNT